jgi:raffinose/stachyose/melibiose transport system permease protein
MTQRGNVMTYAWFVFLSLLAVLPLVSMLAVALGKNQVGAAVSFSHGLTFSNFRRAWHVGGLGPDLISSAIVATATTVFATVLAVLAGFAFAILRFPFRTLFFYLLMLGLLFPFESYVVPLFFQLEKYSLTDTYLGLILAETAFAVVFGSFWMRATFRATPRSLLDAARIDGARTWTVIWRILVPPARPAILTMMVLTFVWTWNDFLLPLIVASGGSFETAPLGLALFIGQRLTDYPGLSAGAVIISLPPIIVFLLLQRQFFQGMFAGSAKG